VVLAGVRRGDAEGDALAIDLLPPVLDQATSFGGASPFADVCHCCALDCLMLLPRAAAVAVALHPGRTLASANQAATRRRLETLLLVLSRQPAAAADRLHHELAADALVKRRAPAVATELESLLTDARCPSLELCRHAYLALTERCPRVGAQRLAKLPHRVQIGLRTTAAERSAPLGPPLLPPPPPPPPAAQLGLVQALARGCVARLRLRRLRAFLDEATVGDAVALLPRGHDGLRRGSGLLQPRGHAGTIVWRGRTDLAPGEWFGVCLALPAGRHDGALRGRRYFRCPPRHGLLVRGSEIMPPPAGGASDPRPQGLSLGHGSGGKPPVRLSSESGAALDGGGGVGGDDDGTRARGSTGSTGGSCGSASSAASSSASADLDLAQHATRGELLQRLEEATQSFSEALEAQADPSPSGAERAEAMARLMAAANEQTLLTRRLQQMVLE